jgi:tetratricopeptide (TPR) repeat protein
MRFERQISFPAAAADEPAAGLRDQGRWAEAQDLCLDALARDPNSYPARVGLAVCRLHLGKPRQAYHMFQRALRERPDCLTALFGQAMAHHLAGRINDAVRAYEELVARHTGSVEAWSNLISIALDRDDAASAREYAERLLAIRPNSLEALTALADCDFLQQHFASAAELCQAIAGLRPESFEAWFNLAVARQKAGRLDEAVVHYENALRLRSSAAGAWLNLGLSWHELGDLARARQAYNRVLEPRPVIEVVECRTSAGQPEESPRRLMRTA